MNRRKAPQLEMFGVPHQARRRTPERFEFYLAILLLRKRGHKVYRAGKRAHLVDGKRIWSEKVLLQMAGRKG